LICHWWNMY